MALNSSIPTGAAEDMIAAIARARAAGYRTHSAKVGGLPAAAERARMTAIAAALEADEAVTFDVNRAWTPGLALQILNGIDFAGWIEQPCETLEECARVAAAVPQPLMLDEGLLAPEDHLRAWRQGICAGVKIKPNRVGGLTRARQIRDFGLWVGWQMHIEDTGGSALADTAALHLAATTPDSHRLASWLCHPHLSHDPVPGQGVRNVAGRAHLPTGPGLGVRPDPHRLGAPVLVFA